jgi:hypothetical protein
MPLRSEIYRVLIASPSDLMEERDAATDAITDWNAQHAVAESVVLLPVKWESHATPQTGIRAQDAINNQLVNESDILIGMFWTKIGTNTGVAESGTVEEIDRFVAAEKSALLYFSSRSIDPNKIDLKQFKKLRTFKAACLGHGCGVVRIVGYLVQVPRICYPMNLGGIFNPFQRSRSFCFISSGATDHN